MTDQTLGGSAETAANPFVKPTQPPMPSLDTVLDLDEILDSAARVEKVARFCLAGNLQAEHDELIEELSTLVDEDGNVVSEGDRALSDGTRAGALQGRLAEVQQEMRAKSRTVRFRALASDDWETFQKARQKPDGSWKDPDAANRDLVAACAVAPTMTIEQVNRLASQLGNSQMVQLYNAALLCNLTGGVDIPKLSSFSAGSKRGESATS